MAKHESRHLAMAIHFPLCRHGADDKLTPGDILSGDNNDPSGPQLYRFVCGVVSPSATSNTLPKLFLLCVPERSIAFDPQKQLDLRKCGLKAFDASIISTFRRIPHDHHTMSENTAILVSFFEYFRWLCGGAEGTEDYSLDDLQTQESEETKHCRKQIGDVAHAVSKYDADEANVCNGEESGGEEKVGTECVESTTNKPGPRQGNEPRQTVSNSSRFSDRQATIKGKKEADAQDEAMRKKEKSNGRKSSDQDAAEEVVNLAKLLAVAETKLLKEVQNSKSKDQEYSSRIKRMEKEANSAASKKAKLDESIASLIKDRKESRSECTQLKKALQKANTDAHTES
jgi:hypothetical protein